MFDTQLLATIAQEAVKNNIEPALLQAVVSIESSGQPFYNIDGTDKPVIRFEGHYFYARLKGDVLDKAVKAGLASKTPGAVANPTTGKGRYDLLARAAEIDESAAYESTSWGLGQVMGANWKDLGYPTVQDFVNDNLTVAGQIDMIIKFVKVNGLLTSLQSKDWKKFARGYNGPNYGDYDQKLAKAYEAFSNQTTNMAHDTETGTQAPVDEIVQLQTMLNAIGNYGISVDGVIGISTKTSIRDFQLKNGLTVDGVYGPLTKSKLEATYVNKTKHGQSVFGAGATSIGVVGTALSEAAKQIQPLIQFSQTFQFAFVGLIVIGAAITAWALFRKGSQQ